MTLRLIDIITATDEQVRNRPLDALCRSASLAELLEECASLEAFRHTSDNLYERVRACFFLFAIHRFHIPTRSKLAAGRRIPFIGYVHLLERRFEKAIELFLQTQAVEGANDALSSALAAAYHRLAFQTLADQVRRSVRLLRGNQWMFRTGHPHDQPLRVRPELQREHGSAEAPFPVLKEATPVRMDLTHSAWSDIFFLGMDFPEGARVLNVSIDLAVQGSDQATPRPPIEAYFRVIDEPVLRLTSVDLATTADITDLSEVFDFARDYLGLLKAALIASGLVPPGIEGYEEDLTDLLERLVGVNRGIELVSSVNDIPKGSRLAVSTNLLASLITVCMRATGQTRHLTGTLAEEERRQVVGRAILGEWLAGSGGGWQDSGGVWPGIKLIEAERAREGDPEFGISRGCLLPRHHILDQQEATAEAKQKLQDSLVLVHGGMAQNVGPVLEMVTEKYLLRSEAEWHARLEAIHTLDEIRDCLRRGDIQSIGQATTRNFFGPLQTIVPWSSNFYTEILIDEVRSRFADDFWGFWMLGGMSGGGMGFIFNPARKPEAQDALQEIMSGARSRFEHALPFAMEPVVYDFAINERGTHAELLPAEAALLPAGYYALIVPGLMRLDPRKLTLSRRAELDAFGAACRTRPELSGMVQTLFDRLLPRRQREERTGQDLASLLEANGFDHLQHEQIRSDLKSGRIGLTQNRLPVTSDIRDVEPNDVYDGLGSLSPAMHERGMQALAEGRVAVVSLAAGVGSRWTQGAGVVKALHPFAKVGGRHRTFVETHLAKSRRTGRLCGQALPHVFTTSYLTHAPIESYLAAENNYGYRGPLLLSGGRAIGLRLVPTLRDLRFTWDEMHQQVLDEQAQKMRTSLHAALIEWARAAGEASDYTDNVPSQCLHPVGHWYEIPNMMRNGTLARLLEERPKLEYLMLHNIDTLGADVAPGLLGLHISGDAALTIEVISRRLEDRGGGLARVNGRLRLVEGLAMPREEKEFELTYYNSMTTWIDIDKLLAAFNLTRDKLDDEVTVAASIRALASRIPTYITIKDVKRRWGHGHEDIYPVAQFEKLWGDMTMLPELKCRFVSVSRLRGQQLKEQAQLDGWLRDGSAAYVESLCAWQ
ncbi:MAG: UTP--glucose-1-phosphate uridylyltransferase [Acidobacteriota bacterium]|nr:UTP--glucose-1-phosphate uridylyltransferase [Acidobacteriota bacterium]